MEHRLCCIQDTILYFDLGAPRTYMHRVVGWVPSQCAPRFAPARAWTRSCSEATPSPARVSCGHFDSVRAGVGVGGWLLAEEANETGRLDGPPVQRPAMVKVVHGEDGAGPVAPSLLADCCAQAKADGVRVDGLAGGGGAVGRGPLCEWMCADSSRPCSLEKQKK